MKYYLTKELASFIKMHSGFINVSFDLGMTENIYDADQLKKKLPLDEIRGNWVYVYDDKTKELYKLAFFTDHLYRVRVIRGFPILEIDGIRMNLIKELDPLQYAKRVVGGLNPRGKVLECCMGLGYITKELIRNKKVEKVFSVEKSKEVIELSKLTPWFFEIHESDKVEIINKDIIEFVGELLDRGKKEMFDFIVHDPPTISFSGELYSRRLYSKFFELLKEGGRLYHYVGFTGYKRGKNLVANVVKRLEDVGFSVLKFDRKLKGVFVLKK